MTNLMAHGPFPTHGPLHGPWLMTNLLAVAHFTATFVGQLTIYAHTKTVSSGHGKTDNLGWWIMSLYTHFFVEIIFNLSYTLFHFVGGKVILYLELIMKGWKG